MEQQDIVVSRCYLADVLAAHPGCYLNHVLCLSGQATLQLADGEVRLHHGDMAILLPQTSATGVAFSPDYRGRHLLLSARIARANRPSVQWGERGFLFAHSNPVFHFSDEQIAVFERSLEVFSSRLADRGHLFYGEVLASCVRTFLYDMWNIYAPELEKRITGPEGGDIFDRFLSLVALHCRREREVAFYADKLCITPKYLSEVCRKRSGRAAMEWIKDHAAQEIAALLRDPRLTIADVADRMAFDNTSFFCRYVKRVLGKTPTEWRKSL